MKPINAVDLKICKMGICTCQCSKELFPVVVMPTMPSSSLNTTGKPITAECRGLCRVPDHGHSANTIFAECQPKGTRQTRGSRHALTSLRASRRQSMALGNHCSLPSATRPALGKDRARAQHARPPLGWLTALSLCRVPGLQHSANVVFF